MTPSGFWLVAAESRYTRGFPCDVVVARIGKSFLMTSGTRRPSRILGSPGGAGSAGRAVRVIGRARHSLARHAGRVEPEGVVGDIDLEAGFPEDRAVALVLETERQVA